MVLTASASQSWRLLGTRTIALMLSFDFPCKRSCNSCNKPSRNGKKIDLLKYPTLVGYVQHWSALFDIYGPWYNYWDISEIGHQFTLCKITLNSVTWFKQMESSYQRYHFVGFCNLNCWTLELFKKFFYKTKQVMTCIE